MRTSISSLLAFVAVLSINGVASADDAPPVQVAPQAAPAPQLPPSNARAANGEYVAPMQQQTQPTYIPQSVAMSGPREIRDYDEDTQRPPAGYHPEKRIRKGLVIGGAVTFGIMYLFSAMAAAIDADTSRGYGERHSTLGALWVPVAGPFVQMARTQSSTGNFFLAIDGIAQLGGAAMLIGGFAAPKTVLVRDDLAKIWIAPTRIGKDGYGLGMNGAF